MTGYQLDGMHLHLDGIILAGNDEGMLFMFKLANGSGDAEVVAETKVYGGPYMVGCRHEHAQYDCGNGSHNLFRGLLMRKFEGTLDTDSFQLSLPALLKRAKAVILAVNHIHTLNLVHMDIKDGNVFVKDGLWFIGDFGSCVPIGEPIGSTSHPQSRALVTTPAYWKYDWYMLCMVIARQLNVHGEIRFVLPQMHDTTVERINLCENVELKCLLNSLLLCDAQFLNFVDKDSFERVLSHV